jgi:hypothetical protein
MRELSLLVARLRAIQAFSEAVARRSRRGEVLTVELQTMPPAKEGWLRLLPDAARRVTEGLAFRFVRPAADVAHAARPVRRRAAGFALRALGWR